MTFSEIMHKKVAGIPVIYLAGAAVAILAVVAWRMKPKSDSEEVPPDAGGPEDTSAVDEAADYSGLATQGTVTVVQQPASTDNANPTIETNQTWISKGTQWLVAEKNVLGADASLALTKHVNGQDQSFQEREWINAVYKQFGPPPDGAADGGGTAGAKPATKQFTPPGVHTVAGNTDNTYPALAALYYGSSAGDRVDLLQAANASALGRSGPWAAGTKVTVPAYHAPVYYSVPKGKGETASQVASKNGINITVLAYLNNPKNEAYAPNFLFKPGTRIRVK